MWHSPVCFLVSTHCLIPSIFLFGFLSSFNLLYPMNTPSLPPPPLFPLPSCMCLAFTSSPLLQPVSRQRLNRRAVVVVIGEGGIERAKVQLFSQEVNPVLFIYLQCFFAGSSEACSRHLQLKTTILKTQDIVHKQHKNYPQKQNQTIKKLISSPQLRSW